MLAIFVLSIILIVWEPPGNLTLKAIGVWLQSFHRTGETDSWRAQANPCAHQHPGERSSDPTRDWARLASECPGVSDRGMGWQWPAVASGPCLEQSWNKSFWRRSLFPLTLPCLTSGETAGREHSPTHKQKMGLRIAWEWLHPSEQDPDAPTAIPSHQEASKSFLSLSIRGHTEWEPQLQKINQSDHWSQTALSNSVKLWIMLCRSTQNGRVMVESSNKMWSTGERNGKPLQYSSLENPTNSMKWQKDRTLKDELSVGRCLICYWRRMEKKLQKKMKRLSQNENNAQLWMWLGIEVKSKAVKNSIV